MTRRAKPVIHGRDHAADGPDPIPGPIGGGINFDTQPQDGDWLYVRATATNPAGPVSGIALVADQDIYLDGEHGISLETTGPTAGDDINLSADAASVNLAGGTGIAIRAFGTGGIILDCSSSTGDLVLTLGTGVNLVVNGLPTSNPGGAHRVWNNGGVLNIT